jgi:hypothetical protein
MSDEDQHGTILTNVRDYRQALQRRFPSFPCVIVDIQLPNGDDNGHEQQQANQHLA